MLIYFRFERNIVSSTTTPRCTLAGFAPADLIICAYYGIKFPAESKLHDSGMRVAMSLVEMLDQLRQSDA